MNSVHDAGGNTLYDGNNEYWYDAEGQQCAVALTNSNGNPIAPATQYLYDAEGARIGKLTLSTPPAKYTGSGAAVTSPSCAPPLLTALYSPGVASGGVTLTTRYLVDLGGDQVTELNTTSGTYAWAHSNVFSAARLTATYDVKYTNSVNTGGLHYELADPLGTKRVQANISGVVEMTWASLPFGDALTPIAPTNPPSTSDDATEHHFTQKERDTESNNDYFFARYYNSAIGRFTTPDWSAKVVPVPYAKLDNPQSLNLYSYVLNNPLSRVDSNGHDVVLGNTTDKDRKATARRVTQNLSAEEKKMFKVGVDKATHRNELMLKPGAKLDGHHTEAFSRLVTEVSDHQHTATVKLQSNFTDQNGEVQSVAGPAAGGGVTRDLGGGNSLILLAPEGNLSEPLHPGTLPGLTGGRVDDPTSTIAGHELMGHGYELMTTGTSDEGTTRQFENRMRSEEGESPRSIQ